MKKILVCVALIATASLAAKVPTFHGKVVTEKDDFTGSTVSMLKLKHQSKEKTAIFFSSPLDCLYKKEVKKGKNTPMSFDFSMEVMGGLSISDMENKVYLKIDGDVYPVAFGNINVVVAYHEGDHGSGYTVSTYTASVILTPEADEKIANSKELVYRFNVGNKPYTYEISKNKRQYNLIKKLYNPDSK